MSENGKGEEVEAAGALTLSAHISKLETIGEIVEQTQTFEQQFEQLKIISENTDISEEVLVQHLKSLDLPKSVSLPDVLIGEMQRHDITNKLRVINKLFHELIVSFSSQEEDPEYRSATENNFRALGVALQHYAGDHAAQILRSRDTAVSLVKQLSKAINIITSVGQAFEIEVDNQKVETTIDFSKWPYERLERLAVQLMTYSEQLTRQHEVDSAKVQSMTSTVNEMRTKEEKIEDRNKNDYTALTSKIEILDSSLKRLHQILSSFKDQDCWVVAKVDPITRSPTRFYYEDENNVIRNSKNMEKAIVRSLKKAREVRFDVAKHLQENAKRNEFRTISDRVVVMRIFPAEVDLASEYEE